MNKTLYNLLASMCFLFLTSGSCSHLHIDGYIEYDKDEISVNDSLFLTAVVTDEVQPRKVLWDFVPVGTDSKLISPFPENSNGNKYNAVFIPSEPGGFTIYLRFFYKSTSPSVSDSLYIMVKDQ